MLAQKLPHDDRSRIAHVEALHLTELRNRKRLNIRIIRRIETQAIFLMAEYEGAAPWERPGVDGRSVLRFQGEQSVAARSQFAVNAGEAVMKTCRHPLE